MAFTRPHTQHLPPYTTLAKIWTPSYKNDQNWSQCPKLGKKIGINTRMTKIFTHTKNAIILLHHAKNIIPHEKWHFRKTLIPKISFSKSYIPKLSLSYMLLVLWSFQWGHCWIRKSFQIPFQSKICVSEIQPKNKSRSRNCAVYVYGDSLF